MNKLTKVIFTFLLIVSVATGYSTATMADTKSELIIEQKKQIIELVQEIEDLGETPIKKYLLQNRKKYIARLKEQLEKLKKEKGLDEKKQAVMEELKKQIEALDPDAKLVTDDSTDVLDEDKDIIALKKQLEDLKIANKEKKKKAGDKKKADKKSKEAKEKEKEKRDAAMIRIKKEIYFLGGTPIAEFEVESEDAYIEALKKQIEELKIQKEAEEKEIAESIPEWFLMPPQGSDVLMYVRGTGKSGIMQMALDIARDAAHMELGQKVEIRLASKIKKTIRQAGMDEDQAAKTEINLISSTVVKEVAVSGIETIETKLVSLDNGDYRAFVLIKYPVVNTYKAYIEKIEESPKLKGRLTLIQNTDAYKDLQKAVNEFAG